MKNENEHVEQIENNYSNKKKFINCRLFARQNSACKNLKKKIYQNEIQKLIDLKRKRKKQKESFIVEIHLLNLGSMT